MLVIKNKRNQNKIAPTFIEVSNQFENKILSVAQFLKLLSYIIFSEADSFATT